MDLSAMGEQPVVTVYIPCHNYGRYLMNAVTSVERQSYEHWELIVVDDGSTDDTGRITSRLRRRRSIRVLENPEPIGLRAVANQCFEAAQGSYVLRLDADDELHPRALELLVTEVVTNPSISMVFPDYYYMDDRGNVSGVETLPEVDGEYRATSIPPHGAGCLVSRDLVRRFGGFDESLARQDGHELWLRVLESGSGVRHVALPLFYYRRHTGSLSQDQFGLLRDRAQVKQRIVGRQRTARETVGVLTVCNTNPVLPEIPFAPFKSTNLLAEALMEALLADELDQLAVTTDCPRVAAYTRERFPSVDVVERAPELRGHDADMGDILREAAAGLNAGADTLLAVLNLHTPFRSAAHISDAVHTLLLYDVDSVVSVYEEHNVVYQLGARGLEPINPSLQYQLRREREVIYVDNAAVRVFPANNLRGASFLGTRVGHILMSREDGFKINSPSDIIKLAESRKAGREAMSPNA